MSRFRPDLAEIDIPITEGTEATFWVKSQRYIVRADFPYFWSVVRPGTGRTTVEGSFLLRRGRFEVMRTRRWVDAGTEWRDVVADIIAPRGTADD